MRPCFLILLTADRPEVRRVCAVSFSCLAIGLDVFGFADSEKRGDGLVVVDALDALAKQLRDAERSDREAVTGTHRDAIGRDELRDGGFLQSLDGEIGKNRVGNTG